MPPEQDESAGWADPMVFAEFPGGEVDCAIVETATGASPGYDVATTMTVDRGASHEHLDRDEHQRAAQAHVAGGRGGAQHLLGVRGVLGV